MFWIIQFSSVTQSFLTVCDPMDYSTPGLPVHHQFLEFTQTHVHWVGDAKQPSHLCYPLLLLPSIFPSIRVLSNESVLLVRWLKYWSFSFIICPSNEYSRLSSLRIDWFDLLAVQGTLKNLLCCFSGNWPELTLENGALFTRPRKPHKIMQIKRFKSSCSL